MTRLTFFVFFGTKRFKTTAHESGWSMSIPLIVLAGCALFGGALGLPHLFSELLAGHPPSSFAWAFEKYFSSIF